MNIFELNPIDSRKSFYGKAFVEENDDGCATLYSYNTPVASYTPNSGFKRLWGDYSATTMRHVNSFLSYYGVPGGGKKWWDEQPVMWG